MFISAWALIISKFIIYVEQKGIKIPRIKYYFNMYWITFNFFLTMRLKMMACLTFSTLRRVKVDRTVQKL